MDAVFLAHLPLNIWTNRENWKIQTQGKKARLNSTTALSPHCGRPNEKTQGMGQGYFLIYLVAHMSNLIEKSFICMASFSNPDFWLFLKIWRTWHIGPTLFTASFSWNRVAEAPLNSVHPLPASVICHCQSSVIIWVCEPRSLRFCPALLSCDSVWIIVPTAEMGIQIPNNVMAFRKLWLPSQKCISSWKFSLSKSGHFFVV